MAPSLRRRVAKDLGRALGQEQIDCLSLSYACYVIATQGVSSTVYWSVHDDVYDLAYNRIVSDCFWLRRAVKSELNG